MSGKIVLSSNLSVHQDDKCDSNCWLISVGCLFIAPILVLMVFGWESIISANALQKANLDTSKHIGFFYYFGSVSWGLFSLLKFLFIDVLYAIITRVFPIFGRVVAETADGTLKVATGTLRVASSLVTNQ